MKRTITIIILSVIIVILLAVITFGYFGNKKTITKLEKSNENLLTAVEDYQKQLKEKKVITIEKIKLLTDPEKEKLIMDQQDTLLKNMIVIDELKQALEKTNNELKKQYKPKHSIEAFVLAGIDTTLTPDIYIGLTYMRTFYITNKLAFCIGGGAGYKPYYDKGGALFFQTGFKF